MVWEQHKGVKNRKKVDLDLLETALHPEVWLTSWLTGESWLYWTHWWPISISHTCSTKGPGPLMTPAAGAGLVSTLNTLNTVALLQTHNNSRESKCPAAPQEYSASPDSPCLDCKMRGPRSPHSQPRGPPPSRPPAAHLHRWKHRCAFP